MKTGDRGQPGDAEALAHLAERTFRNAFTAGNDPVDVDLHCAERFGPGIQRQEILNPDCVTILAEVDRELVAFAQLYPFSPKDGIVAKRRSELYRLYVADEWYGRGLAHAVTVEVLATAARAESDCIWLGVWEHNPRAMACYGKHGFRVVGEHVFRFDRERQRDFVMVAAIDRSSVA